MFVVNSHGILDVEKKKSKKREKKNHTSLNKLIIFTKNKKNKTSHINQYFQFKLDALLFPVAPNI